MGTINYRTIEGQGGPSSSVLAPPPSSGPSMETDGLVVDDEIVQ
jgi:hypothetical protein